MEEPVQHLATVQLFLESRALRPMKQRKKERGRERKDHSLIFNLNPPPNKVSN
jgi:hypothetical protein